MATLSISKTYDDGTLLEESDLDPLVTAPQTFVNTTKLNDDNISNSGITGSSKLKDGSVTTAKIVNNGITESLIAAGAVTSAKITDANITTAKINDLAVTTAKINDAAVTTGKLAASAVTSVKCTANWAITSVPATTSAGSGVRTITVAQVTITGNSRPTLIVASCPMTINVSATTSGGTVSFCKGNTATSIANFTLESSGLSAPSNTGGFLSFVDTTGASGSTTYYIVINTTTNTNNVSYGPALNDDSYFLVQEL